LKNKDIKQVVCGGQFAIAIGPTKLLKAKAHSKPAANDENRPTNKNVDLESFQVFKSEKKIAREELDRPEPIFNINTISFSNSENKKPNKEKSVEKGKTPHHPKNKTTFCENVQNS
jgi:hypothetical protein